MVYFGSDDGYLYALNAANGSLIWNYSTGGPVKSSPAVVDCVVYVGSNDGKVYAIGTNQGVFPSPTL
jgi:outer membrane protein assembly factor BamB